VEYLQSGFGYGSGKAQKLAIYLATFYFFGFISALITIKFKYRH
jgi:hypothetical protein